MRVLKIKQALRTNASKIGAQNRQGAEWVHRPRGGCFAVEAPILSPHLPGLLFLAFGGGCGDVGARAGSWAQCRVAAWPSGGPLTRCALGVSAAGGCFRSWAKRPEPGSWSPDSATVSGGVQQRPAVVEHSAASCFHLAYMPCPISHGNTGRCPELSYVHVHCYLRRWARCES